MSGERPPTVGVGWEHPRRIHGSRFGERRLIACVAGDEGRTDRPDRPGVETNAVVREHEVQPVAAGGFPRPVRSLLRGHVDTIETVVEASRTGDLDAAFEGFLLDQQVRTLSPDDDRDLFAELVAAEGPYLDDWDVDGSTVLAEASTYPAE
ncbi:hypothetical protein GQS65_02965 [Halomarina oriensis]|uniref:Glycosyl hydrolase family 4 C-terminal domain-containing protein n=1 Tax=Halomarina oriensis TaxID=671145 RepID=A0A6B0GJ52_9EURY|nr:hypothetical protein [Halomarina oriensis]MWG33459.1 hypothetical protein [Halomarina oriensis]